MLTTFIIIVIGFLAFLCSFWAMRKYQRHKRNHRNRIRQNIPEYIPSIALNSMIEQIQTDPQDGDFPSDRYYLEGVGYIIGDITCEFNAQSSHIRCAVNPLGPCENCPHYSKQQQSDYQSDNSQ
ncbi:hypothetical protein H6F32_00645 [Anabaena sp. FACHB-1237]|uniref:DUF6464 family protein n=1 Tax=Anabaena sp. FACHB-1237 TaxID=2692769 RepID=UPI001681B424|nr:DUF6464 family protein [Anabaena sp. FACHB-1237]MBD2136122.1 hypothetical protein [Anabaena sp. FACHB-1237]